MQIGSWGWLPFFWERVIVRLRRQKRDRQIEETGLNAKRENRGLDHHLTIVLGSCVGNFIIKKRIKDRTRLGGSNVQGKQVGMGWDGNGWDGREGHANGGQWEWTNDPSFVPKHQKQKRRESGKQADKGMRMGALEIDWKREKGRGGRGERMRTGDNHRQYNDTSSHIHPSARLGLAGRESKTTTRGRCNSLGSGRASMKTDSQEQHNATALTHLASQPDQLQGSASSARSSDSDSTGFLCPGLIGKIGPAAGRQTVLGSMYSYACCRFCFGHLF